MSGYQADADIPFGMFYGRIGRDEGPMDGAYVLSMPKNDLRALTQNS